MSKQTEKLIEGLDILVVDPNPYMRKLTRMMLMNVGAKSIVEAADGLMALDLIRHTDPDVVLLDWDMPMLSGPQIMHIVRSPGVFAKPHLPVIMLTDSVGVSKVREAMRLVVHELLLKPTSPNALRERLLSIVLRPRPMVQLGDYYVPQPRRSIAVSEPPRSESGRAGFPPGGQSWSPGLRAAAVAASRYPVQTPAQLR
jgi:two-component system chemotaxis response regulator CheY